MTKNSIAMGFNKVNDTVTAAILTFILQDGNLRVFPYRFPCDPELVPTEYKFVCSVKRSLTGGAKEARNLYRDAKGLHHFIECN